MQAHYIKIEWMDDPIVYGKLEGDDHTYFEYIHATPYYSDHPVRAYTPTQLTLCKKESQLQSKKMDFSQEKSRKGQKIDLFLTFP